MKILNSLGTTLVSIAVLAPLAGVSSVVAGETPSRGSPALTYQEAFAKTTALCEASSAPTFAGQLEDGVIQAGEALRFYVNGIEGAADNMVLATLKTRTLLENPGYQDALEKCFGDNSLQKTAFSFSIFLLDRMGYWTDWIVPIGMAGVFARTVGLSRFALAHSVLFKRIGYVLAGVNVAAFVGTSVVGALALFHSIQARNAEKRTARDPVTDVQPVLDETWAVVRERISEIDAELLRPITEERRRKLEEWRVKLEEILAQGDPKPSWPALAQAP